MGPVSEILNRSPFNRPGPVANRPFVRSAASDQCDISFVSSGMPSMDCGEFERTSTASEFSTDSPMIQSVSLQNIVSKSNIVYEDNVMLPCFSIFVNATVAEISQEDVEAEMRRLRLELKQTIDMYSTACKEALSAKQKVKIAFLEPKKICSIDH